MGGWYFVYKIVKLMRCQYYLISVSAFGLVRWLDILQYPRYRVGAQIIKIGF